MKIKTLSEAREAIDVQSAELESKIKQIDELNSKIEELETQLNESKIFEAKCQELETHFNQVLSQKEEEIKSLSSEIESVKISAVEVVSSIGAEPVQSDPNPEAIDVFAQFKEIKDPVEKTKFYQQHRDKLNPFKK